MFCLNLLKNGIHYYTVFQWKYFSLFSFLATLLLSFLLSGRRYGTLALCSSVLRDAAYSGQVAHCTYLERPFPLRSTWRRARGTWNNPQRYMVNLLSSRSILNVWYLPVCFQDSLLVVSKSFTVSYLLQYLPWAILYLQLSVCSQLDSPYLLEGSLLVISRQFRKHLFNT